ncbi:MliC family protein [Meiothermus granaticius]|uniref:Membrane-bound lysozyme-inhibitor of c-type lysozyme n=1 Tax=Meiothermus granaticius NBRC 107808 TaxID=1227551 RepID=A0A399FCC6_9DEIN|nr:MliC family protein [Meiothermus granaticius]RIH93880.1 Membrane-bound lysozyme-inhibitor of c-type lysozyme [Meiothermus granaticius NBRC 107808]
MPLVLWILGVMGLGWVWAGGGSLEQAPKPVQYRCADGFSLAVTYLEGGQLARFRYGGRTYTLRTALSADGARYVSGNLEWWTRGNRAFLATLRPDKILHRDCLAQ